MMEFIVLNREQIKTFCTNKKHIVISIMDPGDSGGPADIPANRKRMSVLRLAFHDWNEKQKDLIKKSHSVSEQDFVFFDEKMAGQIVEFVRGALKIGRLELIVCQCEAGISRSAGVAAGLAKCINGDDAYFFKHFLPNSLVYSLIVKEWNRI